MVDSPSVPKWMPFTVGAICVIIHIHQEMEKLLHAWNSIIRLGTNILAVV